MAKHTAYGIFTTIPLSHTASLPLYRQLFEGLRQAILSGQLLPETKLPSTRSMATELGISRITVLNAFKQLMAEGYLEGRHGSGTYVAQFLPDDQFFRPYDAPIQTPERRRLDCELSQRGRRLALPPRMPLMTEPNESQPRPFSPGSPALDEFPLAIWTKLLARCWRQAPYNLLDYAHGAGYSLLREAIATYLSTARGVRCTAEQVIIVFGSQQGIDLVARVLLDEGDAVWFEDPGYPGAYGAFQGAGARIIPIPVDSEGLSVCEGIKRAPRARLAFVTPSHQFPLGITMSLRRRFELLAWASHEDAFLLEDDYDSEYRYNGRPHPALQGLDRDGRVIYLGTFSKVMFPALRLGYLVVPEELVEAFVNARFYTTGQPPSLEQQALALFISEGHFVRHIRRMRTLYAKRQAALVSAVQRELSGLLDIQSAEAGMTLLGWLASGVADTLVAQRAEAYGIDTIPLSTYCIEAKPCGALVLGYTAINEKEIYEGVRRLARAFFQG